VLLPSVYYSFNEHHIDFPGTIAVEGETIVRYVTDIGKSLAHHGFRKILLVNGHGGNIPAIKDAVAQLRAEGRQCHVWHAGLPASPTGLPADAHAGRFETSVMLALAPDDVRLGAAAPGDTRPLAQLMPDLAARGVRAVSANGILGDPAGASADEGEQLLDLLVHGLSETIGRLLVGLEAN